ncbi:S1/P1 nuclease [Sphingomonas psychrolutea]|uniref:Endonuclease n=1 Tax=Sphingomonas psychrolutea TaxID=1259676 RepID=A0ABQ1GEC4_9SPHN|nr:S1/P1 nuclease [Sphingomonas psychrolutea]GGA42177.1 endonuclease [Sphingomonas psychrolutea]
MRRLFVLLAIGIAVTLGLWQPQKAQAWGKLGHLSVCDLAYRNLTPASRETLKDLLQSRRGGITVPGKGQLPDRHYTSFNVGCLEEDELPRRHADNHFINVARTVTVIVDETCPGTGECILAGIKRDLAILKDTSRSREDRVFALMAIGHWVGDIHQPLHVSFADDKGGNGIDAKLTGKCGTSTYRPDNLHGVWDNCLLEAGLFERVRKRADYKKSWSRFTITYRAVDTLQANTTLAEELSFVGTDPVPWANESYQITLDPSVLYCTKVGSTCQYSPTAATKTNPPRLQPIGQPYLQSFEGKAQDRIRRAGFRLAHLINLALDPAYTGPVRDSTQPL